MNHVLKCHLHLKNQIPIPVIESIWNKYRPVSSNILINGGDGGGWVWVVWKDSRCWGGVDLIFFHNPFQVRCQIRVMKNVPIIQWLLHQTIELQIMTLTIQNEIHNLFLFAWCDLFNLVFYHFPIFLRSYVNMWKWNPYNILIFGSIIVLIQYFFILKKNRFINYIIHSWYLEHFFTSWGLLKT